MYYNNYYNRSERTGFVVPFLFGALAGGAAVGVTRPRPIYATSGYPYQSYPYGYPPYSTYPYPYY